MLDGMRIATSLRKLTAPHCFRCTDVAVASPTEKSEGKFIDLLVSRRFLIYDGATKHFEFFDGKVVEYIKDKKKWRVAFEDGDKKEYTEEEILKFIQSFEHRYPSVKARALRALTARSWCA